MLFVRGVLEGATTGTGPQARGKRTRQASVELETVELALACRRCFSPAPDTAAYPECRRLATDDAIEFEWDTANIRHIARHGVNATKSRALWRDDPMDLGFDDINGERR